MTKESTSKALITSENQVPVLYFDNIIDFGIGPSVKRLNLGIETSPNVLTKTATLIIPTNSLIGAIVGLQASIHDNESLKEQIVQAINALKDQISNL